MKATIIKGQTTFKKPEKNNILQKTIFNMADGILTPCNVA